MIEIRYTKDHEYITVDENGIGTVGITNHAQEKLGDITFVEIPAPGKDVKQGEAAGVVESVKAASDVYSPATGTVLEINQALNEKPELVNSDAEGAGWFFKIKPANAADLDSLLDAAGYAKEIGA